MKIKHSLLLLFLLTPFSVYSADELHLHEGKIIKGSIVEEDSSDVMIRLADNMFLRVDKSKIKKIVREDKKQARPTVTMKVLRSSAPASVPPPTVSKARPKTLQLVSSMEEKKKDGVSYVDYLIVNTYAVPGNNFAEVKEAILNRESGKGPLKGSRRMASETKLIMAWAGKTRAEGGKTKWAALVIESTITVSAPEWKAPETVDETSLKEWERFISEIEEHDKGHVEIYHAAMRTLGASLTNLESADGAALQTLSKNLESNWRKRTEKQQEGHDRRDRTSALRAPADKP